MSLIDEARKEIEEIDEKMIELFKQRMSAVDKVLKYKKEHHLAVFDDNREKCLIEKNLSVLNDEELSRYYRIFFEGVLQSSKLYQENKYE